MAVLERVGKCVEVDQAAARDVEDDGALGHLGQLLGADHASSLGVLGICRVMKSDCLHTSSMSSSSVMP